MKIIPFDQFLTIFSQALPFNDYIKVIEKSENKKRFEIYYRRAKIDDDISSGLSFLTQHINILAIGAEWCWDCQTNLPVIARLTECTDKLSFRIIKKEDNEEYLIPTNGGGKIPYVMFFSADGYYLSNWVERPAEAYHLYANIRQKVGWTADQNIFLHEYRKQFLQQQHNFNREVLLEIIACLKKAEYLLQASSRLHLPQKG